MAGAGASISPWDSTDLTAAERTPEPPLGPADPDPELPTVWTAFNAESPAVGIFLFFLLLLFSKAS